MKYVQTVQQIRKKYDLVNLVYDMINLSEIAVWNNDWENEPQRELYAGKKDNATEIGQSGQFEKKAMPYSQFLLWKSFRSIFSIIFFLKLFEFYFSNFNDNYCYFIFSACSDYCIIKLAYHFV